MQREIFIFAAAMALATGHSVSAQERSLTSGEIALYAEMWAMAGVCNQLAGYDVEQDELAAFLNNQRDDASQQDWLTVAESRIERLEAIEAEMTRISALPNGNRRQQSVDENAATLMSRCTRLANSDTAGEFFLRAS